jgi:hypothetical protein
VAAAGSVAARWQVDARSSDGHTASDFGPEREELRIRRRVTRPLRTGHSSLAIGCKLIAEEPTAPNAESRLLIAVRGPVSPNVHR